MKVIDAGPPAVASYEWADARLSASGVSFGFSFLDGLESGSLAAILGNEAQAALLVADHPTLEIVEVVDAGSSSGFPVEPGNTGLLEAVNDALRAVIGDGTYQEIYDRWFDSPAGSVAR